MAIYDYPHLLSVDVHTGKYKILKQILAKDVWDISVIDGHKITDKKELHAKLAKDLSFPTYYGNNLDALYDVLVSEKESTVIKIINPYALQRKLGKKYIEGFFAAISDASDENPRVVLILSSK